MNKDEYEDWYDKGEGSEHMKRQIAKDARENPIVNSYDARTELEKLRSHIKNLEARVAELERVCPNIEKE